MPAPQWPEPVAVIQRLLDAPHGFEFFQAVRLLEQCWAREEGLSRRQMLATRIGFRNSLAQAFPASEIESLRAVWRAAKQNAGLDDGPAPTGQIDAPLEDAAGTQSAQPRGLPARVEITPAFIGFLGTGGVLPDHYTDLFARREQLHQDSAARAFLDIFLHRAVALFYQAWRKHRLILGFESDHRNQTLPLMLAVAGIGHRSMRDRLQPAAGGVSDVALAHFAGPLQRRPLSARSLQQVLSYYFRIQIRLEQFVGRWFTLPRVNQSALGMRNAALGRDLVLGERVLQRDLRARLTLGPLDGKNYRRFLPGGPGALALSELLTLLAGPTLEFEVRLELKAEDIRGAFLHATDAPRLGWDSFLATVPQTGTRADAGYDLQALA